MNPPRPIADWIALWRDLPRHPRQVLLNRAHLWASLAGLAAVRLVNLEVPNLCTTTAMCVALAVLGPSSLISAIGTGAHALWRRGLIWADLDCEMCGDDPDDDGDDGDDPDDDPGPDIDGDGLIREITTYLRTNATTSASHLKD